MSKIRSALKAAGRKRNLDTRALQIQEMLRTEQLAAPAAVAAAFGASTRAAVGIIAELNRQIATRESHGVEPSRGARSSLSSHQR